MFGNKQIEAKLDIILEEIKSFKQNSCVMKQLLWQLQKEKHDLLDRLMASDFEQYKLGTYSPVPARGETPPAVTEEDLKIGNIVDEE